MIVHYFASVCVLFMLILQGASVSEYCFPHLDHVPGCRLYSEDESFDSSKTIAMCSSFDIMSTPTLLSNCTIKLQIYGTENLPTNVPLVPRLQLLSTLELPHNSMYNVSKLMFEGLEKLKYVSLKDNYIRYLPPDVFVNNINLESVDISGNFLTNLEFTAVAVSELKNLKHLYLYENKLIRWIKDSDLVSLENSTLASLDLAGCMIDFIETNAFRPLKSLNSLNISLNLLPEEGLNNLSQSLQKSNLLDLSAYEIKVEPYFSCRFLQWLQTTRLESLDLSGNRFICFPRGNYPHLKSLTLNKCEIVNLYEDSFSGMPNLEFLSLMEHKLTGIDNAFKSNKRLKVLDLRYFAGVKQLSVFNIADFAFENMKELVDLRLSNLPIKADIRRYTLHGLTELRSASLYSNSILSVECFAFETLSSLTDLDLSYNFISDLSNCTFYGLINVKLMDLSSNDLTFLEETHPFQYTPNLETLLLRRNKIVKLSPYIFRNLHIELIALHGNIIQPWYHECIPQGSNLTVLILNENAITHFTQKMFSDLSKLEIVEFSRNPINCSHCSSIELQGWIKDKSSFISDLNKTGNYMCYTPDTLRGEDILTANVSSATLHCFPPEKDYLTPLYIALSLIICITVLSMAIWHRWSWNIKYYTFLMQLRTKNNKDSLDSRTFAFDAYVSYCQSNLEWINNHLVPALEKGNPKIKLCLPDRNFILGLPSDANNIISAIKKSRSTVIIVSHDYLDSNLCLYNIQIAQNILYDEKRNGLIVLFLENIKKSKLTKDLRYVLRTRTCIWWTDNPVGQRLIWERLRQAILRPTDKGISAHIT